MMKLKLQEDEAEDKRREDRKQRWHKIMERQKEALLEKEKKVKEQLKEIERLEREEKFKAEQAAEEEKPGNNLDPKLGRRRFEAEQAPKRDFLDKQSAEADAAAASNIGQWKVANSNCHKGKDPLRAYILQSSHPSSEDHAQCLLRQLQTSGNAHNECVIGERIASTEFEPCNDPGEKWKQLCLKNRAENAQQVCAPAGVNWDALMGKDAKAANIMI